MRNAQTVDAVVVGGGPAGSTIASRLAQLGYQVVLLESKFFPREHIGESIPGSVLPLLKVTGADQRITSAGFLRTRSSLVRWTDRDGTIRRDAEDAPYLQVQRSLFDKILLDHAHDCGVHVMQQACAQPRHDEDGLWHISIKGAAVGFTSRILLDASGRTGLHCKRIRCSPPTLAIYGYFEEGIIQEPVSRVEAFADGWLWGAPLSNGQLACAAFVDSQLLRKYRERSLESFLREQLSNARLFRQVYDNRLCSDVRACDASVSVAEQTMANGLIRIGDASLSMDPLSSQGGVMAISSALQAALLANTLLRYPEREALAESFAHSAQHSRLKQHLSTLAAYYREKHNECDTAFWRSRAKITPEKKAKLPLASSNCRVRLAEISNVRLIPAVEGDVISSAPALHHPALDTPIAYVSGNGIEKLLNCLNDQPSASQLLERWALRVGGGTAVELFSKLWQSGVIIEQNAIQ